MKKLVLLCKCNNAEFKGSFLSKGAWKTITELGVKILISDALTTLSTY